MKNELLVGTSNLRTLKQQLFNAIKNRFSTSQELIKAGLPRITV
jgi:hypothetical protein